ncbi:hypothetical protein ACGFH8_28820 [Micromonospora sp. NPDC049175]|uniref:hypothetical protein n=1 Tax=Micromonospora sp. NPDC049175 TaxID=3364266 RepID=UPI0037105403
MLAPQILEPDEDVVQQARRVPERGHPERFQVDVPEARVGLADDRGVGHQQRLDGLDVLGAPLTGRVVLRQQGEVLAGGGDLALVIRPGATEDDATLAEIAHRREVRVAQRVLCVVTGEDRRHRPLRGDVGVAGDTEEDRQACHQGERGDPEQPPAQTHEGLPGGADPRRSP